jgi:SAM-dependent methyltransferase
MDYNDVISGQTRDNFWSMGKCDLINMFLSLYSKASAVGALPEILNIGAGVGDDLKAINVHGVVHVVDIDKRVLDLIPDDACFEKRVGDITCLPYNANTFDIVTCFDVFEHVKTDSIAFDEVYRVLKNGGLLVFSVPAYPCLYSSHDKMLIHYRRYSHSELLHQLRKFKPEFISYWNCFLFLPVALRRILNRNASPQENVVALSRFQNLFFYRLLRFENQLLKLRIKFPFGLSIFGVCRKEFALTILQGVRL